MPALLRTYRYLFIYHLHLTEQYSHSRPSTTLCTSIDDPFMLSSMRALFPLYMPAMRLTLSESARCQLCSADALV